MFHWRHGIFFGRRTDGSVRLIVDPSPRTESFPNPEAPEGAYGGPLDITIPAAEWASIVSSVSTTSETSESYQAAVALHG